MSFSNFHSNYDPYYTLRPECSTNEEERPAADLEYLLAQKNNGLGGTSRNLNFEEISHTKGQHHPKDKEMSLVNKRDLKSSRKSALKMPYSS